MNERIIYLSEDDLKVAISCAIAALMTCDNISFDGEGRKKLHQLVEGITGNVGYMELTDYEMQTIVDERARHRKLISDILDKSAEVSSTVDSALCFHMGNECKPTAEDLDKIRLDASRWRHARDHVNISFDIPVRFSTGTVYGQPVEVDSQFPAKGIEADNAVDADMLRFQSGEYKDEH